MDARVTGFPFSVTDAPMYYGSTMSFLAVALWFAKPAGIVLTLLVFVVYKLALMFEEYALPSSYSAFLANNSVKQPFHLRDLCQARAH